MNCTVCNKPIVLVPSAAERAAKFGGKPSDYTRMFTTHALCAVLKRADDTMSLMRQTVLHCNEVRVMSNVARGTTRESI